MTQKAKAVKKEQVVVLDKDPRIERVYNTPETFLEKAIEKNVGVEQLEKFMALYERWLKMKSAEKYNVAFSKFQSICPDLKRTTDVKIEGKDGKRGPQYKYQQLGELGMLIKGPLAECGLAYKWVEREEGEKMFCKCVVTHADGHIEEGNEISGLPDTTGSKNALQAKRSTLAYLRRTTLEGILGLSSANVDDDGQGSVGYTDVTTDLPVMNDAQFNTALKNVMDKTMKVEDIQQYCKMSEDQLKALQKAEAKSK